MFNSSQFLKTYEVNKYSCLTLYIKCQQKTKCETWRHLCVAASHFSKDYKTTLDNSKLELTDYNKSQNLILIKSLRTQ